ncbi:MAG: hypothetical protein QW220_03730 [Candidatus Bathyarchaeia archaeon]
MGRRRRRIVRMPKKRIPNVFTCLLCGKRAVTVRIQKNSESAIVQCAACNAKGEVKLKLPTMAPVDAYSLWCDEVYKSSKAA